MCIGIPMKILSFKTPSMALCEGKNLKGGLNILMLDSPQVGDWVLAWNGMAVQTLTEERAMQVQAALDALESASTGKEIVGVDPFADITSQTGSLPPHLAALVNKGH